MTRLLSPVACCLALAVGCSPRSSAPGSGEEGSPTSNRSRDILPTGRYPHAAIYRTSAPWDGAATALLLSEKPLTKGKPNEPRIAIVFYSAADSLSNQRLYLKGIERERGQAIWIERDGKSAPLKRAEVFFETIRATQPVRGRYEVTFPDGRRESGRFQAEWWPSLVPDG